MAKLKMAGEPPNQPEALFKGPTEAPPPPPPEPEPKGAPPQFPEGFESIDSAPRDGRTLRLWFGTGPTEMTPKHMVLARWRNSRQFNSRTRQWDRVGFWVHPHTLLKIGFDFKAWTAVGQISQEEIDLSNAAVHQENLRRAERAKARQTKTTDELRAAP